MERGGSEPPTSWGAIQPFALDRNPSFWRCSGRCAPSHRTRGESLIAVDSCRSSRIKALKSASAHSRGQRFERKRRSTCIHDCRGQSSEGKRHSTGEWMAVLPEEQHAEFKDLYDGMVKRIKTFLATPGEVNKMFDPQAETSIFGYWQHPFDTTFHGSLMQQCQALALARQAIEVAAEEAEVALLERNGRGLPRSFRGRPPRGSESKPSGSVDPHPLRPQT